MTPTTSLLLFFVASVAWGGITTKIVPPSSLPCPCTVTLDAGPCAPAETNCSCAGGSGYAIFRGYKYEGEKFVGCSETRLEWQDAAEERRVWKLWRKRLR